MLNSRVSWVIVAGALVFFLFVDAAAADGRADEIHLARLASLGKAWGRIRYVHPAFARPVLDWDSAGIAAIRGVLASDGPETYAAAVDALASRLRDPLTRVRRERTAATNAAPPAWSRRPDGVLLVSAAGFCPLTYYQRADQVEALAPLIPQTRAIVFDLRTDGANGCDADYLPLEELAPHLIRRAVMPPAYRWVERYRYGEPEPRGELGIVVAHGSTVRIEPAARAHAPRVVFLADDTTAFPSIAVAIRQAAEDSVIVARGDLIVGRYEELSLGEGYLLRVRTADLVLQHPLSADLYVGGGEDPLEVALDVARRRPPPRRPAQGGRSKLVASAAAQVAADRDGYPSRERRILAAYRLWNAIELFYPYDELARGWRETLPGLIAELDEAADAQAYALAIVRAAARVHDPHVRVRGPTIDAYFGTAKAPIVVEPIEGDTVVTRILDESAARAGIKLGDILVAVDGEPIGDRVRRLGAFRPAYDDPSRRAFTIHQRLLFGREETSMTLTLRDGSRTRDVIVATKKFPPDAAERDGQVIQLLAPGVLYVDLDRLPKNDIETVFERAEGVTTLIFDLRGYVNETLWDIAARLNVKRASAGAWFRYRRVGATSAWRSDEGIVFSQPIPSTDKRLFRGRVIVLVDGRTASQAEHACLFFSAAAPVTFVGSPTAGIDGGVTRVTLPGELAVTFTSVEVRHAHGRRVAGIGIVPDVLVRKTRAGVRSARDEVLERALKLTEARSMP